MRVTTLKADERSDCSHGPVVLEGNLIVCRTMQERVMRLAACVESVMRGRSPRRSSRSSCREAPLPTKPGSFEIPQKFYGAPVAAELATRVLPPRSPSRGAPDFFELHAPRSCTRLFLEYNARSAAPNKLSIVWPSRG
jgi:hypothetical protein